MKGPWTYHSVQVLFYGLVHAISGIKGYLPFSLQAVQGFFPHVMYYIFKQNGSLRDWRGFAIAVMYNNAM